MLLIATRRCAGLHYHQRTVHVVKEAQFNTFYTRRVSHAVLSIVCAFSLFFITLSINQPPTAEWKVVTKSYICMYMSVRRSQWVRRGNDKQTPWQTTLATRGNVASYQLLRKTRHWLGMLHGAWRVCVYMYQGLWVGGRQGAVAFFTLTFMANHDVCDLHIKDTVAPSRTECVLWGDVNQRDGQWVWDWTAWQGRNGRLLGLPRWGLRKEWLEMLEFRKIWFEILGFRKDTVRNIGI